MQFAVFSSANSQNHEYQDRKKRWPPVYSWPSRFWLSTKNLHGNSPTLIKKSLDLLSLVLILRYMDTFQNSTVEIAKRNPVLISETFSNVQNKANCVYFKNRPSMFVAWFYPVKCIQCIVVAGFTSPKYHVKIKLIVLRICR